MGGVVKEPLRRAVNEIVAAVFLRGIAMRDLLINTLRVAINDKSPDRCSQGF